jgi:MinD superfamily P-loop ATPase
MRQWVVLSGKGGTGKTTVTASLAQLAAAQGWRLVLADADVDASNLELLLSPQLVEEHEFIGDKVAQVDPGLCYGCGLCEAACRFQAVLLSDGKASIDKIACEGCAACYYECPTGAISMPDRISGEWYRSNTAAGPLFHAQLYAGQENSGKLVTQVRMSAAALAASSAADLLLVDGPPGIGCPAIAAVSGANLALLVTEPSVSGVHDLRRALGMVRHFGVQAVACINKADISQNRADEIAAICQAEGVPLLGAIPFDEAVIEATLRRLPLTAYSDGPAARALRELWGKLQAVEA